MRRLDRREVSVTDIETQTPSPYARTLLFGYVAQFVYEGDSPIAERRAAALSLDQGLLAELLGRAELRELLDPEVLAEVEAELQRLADDRKAKDAEGVADLLRLLGPLSVAEITARTVPGTDVADWRLAPGRRPPRRAGPDGRRRALGGRRGRRPAARRARACRCRPAPPTSSPSPSRTRSATWSPATPAPTGRSPSTTWRPGSASAPRSSGTPSSGSAAQGRVLDGEFRPGRDRAPSGATPRCCAGCAAGRWPGCARRSSRSSPQALGRFLPAWQTVADATRAAGLRGVDGVLTAIDQLAGAPVPASALEPLVLAARVRDYEPAYLDELTASGEVDLGRPRRPARHRRLGRAAPRRPGAADPARPPTPFEHSELAPGRARRARRPAAPGSSASSPTRSRSTDDRALAAALWDLVWAGRRQQRHPHPAAGPDPRRQHRPPHPQRPRGAAPPCPGARGCPAAAARPETAGRWAHPAGARHRPDPARARRRRAAARPARRGHPRRGDERAGARRLRRPSTRCSSPSRSPAAAAAATSSVVWAPPSSAPPARSTGCAPSPRCADDAKPVAVALAATDPANPYGARSPGRTARRTPRATARATARAARPARWWCWSTVTWRCTSSAAARTLLTWADDAGAARLRPPPGPGRRRTPRCARAPHRREGRRCPAAGRRPAPRCGGAAGRRVHLDPAAGCGCAREAAGARG